MKPAKRPMSVVLAGAVMGLVAGSAGAADWRFETVNGRPVEGAAVVTFNADGTFGGSTGCNQFQGGGRFAEGELVVDGPVAMTKMACPGDALTAQDDTIAALFSTSAALAFDPFNERLILTRGALSATLARAGAVHLPEPAPPTAELPETEAAAPLTVRDAAYVNVFGISDKLRIHAEANLSSKVVGHAESGSLFRNLGCRSSDGRDWCNIEIVDSSGTKGWAAAEYLEPAVASLRAGQDLFDGIGKLACIDAAGGAMAECDYGVARDPDGTAVVAVFRGDGTTRFFSFRDGVFQFADASEAAGGFDAIGRREGDTVVVTLAGERYEVPASALEVE